MSILGFSALNKIKKIVNSEFGNLEKTSVVSISEIINYTDINIGNVRLIDIGSLPENSILLNSSIDVDIPFLSGSTSPAFSLGVEIDEEVPSDYPTTRDNRFLVFEPHILDTAEVVNYQGSLGNANTDKVLNKNANSLIARFNMRNVWSAGGSLSTGRHEHGGCGSQNSSLVFGGFSGVRITSSEEYNGSSWSAGGVLGAAKDYIGSNGSQISALCMGGYNGSIALNTSEEYNGTSWSAGGNLNTARWGVKSIGTQDAALCFSGYTGSVYTAVTESYNGTAWANENSLNVIRTSPGYAGIKSAGLCIGGVNSGTRLSSCEEYNGSNWITANSILVSANSHNGSAGYQYAASIFGGKNSSDVNVATTQEYDGTNWSLSNNMNTTRASLSGAGISMGALAAGGTTSLTTTEEYNPSSLSGLTQGSLTLSLSYTHR